MKKETIEEAAQKYVEGGIYLNEAEKQQTEISFYEGANWQAKRMYSEEDVQVILSKLLFDLKHKGIPNSVDWFEQFKKK